MDGLEVGEIQPRDLCPEGRLIEGSLHGLGGRVSTVQIPDDVVVFDCLRSGLGLTLHSDVAIVVSDTNHGRWHSTDRSAVTENIGKVAVFHDVGGNDNVGSVDFLVPDRLPTAPKSKHQYRTSDRTQPHPQSPASAQR